MKRLYRILLRIYPAGFREECAPELERQFSDEVPLYDDIELAQPILAQHVTSEELCRVGVLPVPYTFTAS